MTREIIERLRRGGVGEPRVWRRIIRRMDGGGEPNADDVAYVARLARAYQNRRVPSRIVHTRLSEDDPGEPCALCGSRPQYYCNMNDRYFCQEHVVGHDENESR